MVKTRLEKIEKIKEEIAQQQNQIKKLMQQQRAQDRKDRTRRLCQRMGLFESMLPDVIILTDEQFKLFLEKTILTERSSRILDGLTEQNPADPTSQSVESVSQTYIAPVAKPVRIEQESSEDTSGDEGRVRRVTG